MEILIRAPPPHMSIFSLVKGEKRTRSVRNANVEEGRPEWLLLYNKLVEKSIRN